MQSKSQKAEISDASGAPGVSEHTLTPWSLWEPLFFDDVAIIGGDGFRVVVTSNGNKDRLRSTHKANAAFIVRAVNSHDALVASVRALLECYWGSGDGVQPAPALITEAWEALRLAEAKS